MAWAAATAVAQLCPNDAERRGSVMFGTAIGERAAGDVLEHEIGKAVAHPGGVHANDVGVAAQSAERLAFPLEASLIVLVLERAVADLHRHLAVEVDLPSEPHLAEPARPDPGHRLDSGQRDRPLLSVHGPIPRPIRREIVLPVSRGSSAAPLRAEGDRRDRFRRLHSYG